MRVCACLFVSLFVCVCFLVQYHCLAPATSLLPLFSFLSVSLSRFSFPPLAPPPLTLPLSLLYTSLLPLISLQVSDPLWCLYYTFLNVSDSLSNPFFHFPFLSLRLLPFPFTPSLSSFHFQSVTLSSMLFPLSFGIPFHNSLSTLLPFPSLMASLPFLFLFLFSIFIRVFPLCSKV